MPKSRFAGRTFSVTDTNTGKKSRFAGRTFSVKLEKDYQENLLKQTQSKLLLSALKSENGRLTVDKNIVAQSKGFIDARDEVNYKAKNPDLYEAMGGIKYIEPGTKKNGLPSASAGTYDHNYATNLSNTTVNKIKTQFNNTDTKEIDDIIEIFNSGEWQDADTMKKYSDKINSYVNNFIALNELGYFDSVLEADRKANVESLKNLKEVVNSRKDTFANFSNADDFNKAIWNDKYNSMTWEELETAEQKIKDGLLGKNEGNDSASLQELHYVKSLRDGFENPEAYNEYVKAVNMSFDELTKNFLDARRDLQKLSDIEESRQASYAEQYCENAQLFKEAGYKTEEEIWHKIKDDSDGYLKQLKDAEDALKIDEKYGSVDALKSRYALLEELYYRGYTNERTAKLVLEAMNDPQFSIMVTEGKKTTKKNKYMTDTEYDVACYYAAKGGKDNNEYSEELEDELQRREIKDRQQKFSSFAEIMPITASITSIPLNIIAAGEQVVDTAKYIATGNVDYNTNALGASTIRNTVSKKMDNPIGSFTYNTIMSGVDSLASMGLSKFITGSDKLGSVILGLSAAGNATNEAINRGLSDGYAFASGVAAGVFETLFESWSIGKFSKAVDSLELADLKNISNFIGKNIWNNALEEDLTEVANIIYDILVNGKYSQYETSIKNYMISGFSEDVAKKKVAFELAGQVGEAAASGALMGFGFSGAGAAKTLIVNKNIKRAMASVTYGQSQESVNALVDNGLAMPEGSVAHSQALKADAKLKNGKSLSGTTLYNLATAIEGEIETKSTARLNELGVDKKTVKELSPVVAKAVFGEQLTVTEHSALNNSEIAAQVVKELSADRANTVWRDAIKKSRINNTTDSNTVTEKGEVLRSMADGVVDSANDFNYNDNSIKEGESYRKEQLRNGDTGGQLTGTNTQSWVGGLPKANGRVFGTGQENLKGSQRIPDVRDQGNNRGIELSQEHKATILRHKSGEAYIINAKLRENETLDESEKHFVNVLSEALQQLPVYEGTVYRNVVFDDFGGEEAYSEFLEQYAPGKLIFYKQFLSCSKERDGYQVEGECQVHFVIESKNVRDVDGYGNNMESEVIYPSDSVFVVKKIILKNNIPTIYLQEAIANVGHNTDEKRSNAVRDMQTPHIVHDNVQGISQRNTDRDISGGFGSQSATSARQRDTVRTRGRQDAVLPTTREEQEVVNKQEKAISENGVAFLNSKEKQANRIDVDDFIQGLLSKDSNSVTEQVEILQSPVDGVVDSVKDFNYNDNSIKEGEYSGIYQRRGLGTSDEETDRTNDSGKEAGVGGIYGETTFAFRRRTKETYGKDGRTVSHLNITVAYKESDVIDRNSPAGVAYNILKSKGYNVVYCDGPILINNNKYTIERNQAVTVFDGTIYISSDSTLNGEGIALHEVVHVWQYGNNAEYSNYESIVFQEIDPICEVYKKVASQINDNHYNGRYDIEDINSFEYIMRELTAYISQYVCTNPKFAREKFGEMFGNWDNVVQAVYDLNNNLGFGDIIKEATSKTQVASFDSGEKQNNVIDGDEFIKGLRSEDSNSVTEQVKILQSSADGVVDSVKDFNYNDNSIKEGEKYAEDYQGTMGAFGGEIREDDTRGKSENAEITREDKISFERRIKRTYKNSGRLFIHLNVTIACKEPKIINSNSSAGVAYDILKSKGYNVVYCDGPILINNNKYTIERNQAVTIFDGTIYISSDSTLNGEGIALHEVVHVWQYANLEKYLNYKDVLCEELILASEKYKEIAKEINDNHYNGRYDIEDINSFEYIMRELTAYISQYVCTNPKFAREKFGGMFGNWDNVVQAVYNLNNNLGFGDIIKEATSKTQVAFSMPIGKRSNSKKTGYINAKVNSTILNFIQKVKNGICKDNEKAYLEKPTPRVAEQIKNITKIDVNSFDVVVEARQIKHIIKDHGENGTTDHSMSNDSDIAKIEYVLNSPDSIVESGTTHAYVTVINGKNKPATTVLYEKDLGNNSYYVVQAVPDTKAKTLYIVSAFIGKKGYKKETSQTIDANSPDATPYSENASVSTNNISDSSNFVNGKMSQNTDNIKYDAINEQEQKYIQTISDKLGRGVVFEDLREMHYKGKIISPDGYIENGVIHLNIYAENPIGFVFKHELTHFAEKASGYAEFVRGVKGSKVYKKWLCEKMGESDIKIAEYKYKRQVAQSHIDIYSASDPKAEAEMIADFVGEMLFTDNGSGLASLVSDVEVKHRNKVVQFVVDFISWLKKKIGGIKSLILELSVLEDSFNRIVSEATDIEDSGEYKYDTGIKFSLRIKRTDGTVEEIEDARNLTEEQAVMYLNQARRGELWGHTYIPVRKDTPTTIIDTLKAADIVVENRSLIMQVRKAQQAMSAINNSVKSKNHGNNIRNHAMSAEQIVEIVNNLDNPTLVILQTNRYNQYGEELPDNVAIFVEYNNNGSEGLAIVEFDSSIDSKFIGTEFGDTNYHTVVTIFEPDTERYGIPFDYAEELLSNPDNYELEIIRRQPTRSATQEKHPNTSNELPSGDIVSNFEENVNKKQEVLSSDDVAFSMPIGKRKRNVEDNVVELSKDNELSKKIGDLHGAVKYKVIQQYILDVLSGQEIVLSDGKIAVVDKSDAQHIARGAGDKKTTQISDIKKIIEKAVLVAEEDSTKERKFDYFCYYEAKVKYDGETFNVYLNVGRATNDKSYHIYDITQKLRDTAHRLNDVGRPPINKGCAVETVSLNNIVPKTAQNVNNDYSTNTDNIKYDAINEQEQNNIQTICDKLGRAVVFEDLREMYYKGEIISPDGYIENGVIHLNTYAENPIGFVFKHELTHFAEKASGYAEFVRGVKDSGVYEKWLCEKMSESDIKIAEYKYKRQVAQSHSDIYSASDPKAEAEMIADFVGEMLFTDNGSGMASLVSNVEVKHRNKVVQFVVDFISWLKKKIGGIKSLTLELSRLEDGFNELLSDAKNSSVNDNEIKFSIAGENSKTANHSLLFEAKLRDYKGEDSESIRQDTGWYKGRDGKWRYYILDNELNIGSLIEFANSNEKTALLGDVITHDKLFAAYPELRNVSIRFDEIGETKRGKFLSDKNEIVLNTKLKDNAEKIKDTLVHEIQHAIQYIEGFALGGNKNFGFVYAMNLAYDKVKDESEFNRLKSKEEKYNVLVSVAKKIFNAENSKELRYKAYRAIYGEVEARQVTRNRLFDEELLRLATPDMRGNVVDRKSESTKFVENFTEMGYTEEEIMNFFRGEQNDESGSSGNIEKRSRVDKAKSKFRKSNIFWAERGTDAIRRVAEGETGNDGREVRSSISQLGGISNRRGIVADDFSDTSISNQKADSKESAFFMPVDKRSNDSDAISEQELNYIQTICGKLDRAVVFEDLREMHYKGKIISPDGYIENGVIHLNTYAENPIGFVFKHELTHFAEKASGYAEFVRGVKDSGVYKKWLCEKMGESNIRIAEYKYKRQVAQSHSDIYSASDPKAEAEMIADFVGEMLFTDNGSGMASLVSDAEVKHRNKVVQFVVDFISWLKKKIGGIKSLTLELSRLEDRFNELLSDIENIGVYGDEVKFSFGITQKDIDDYVDAAYNKENTEDYKKYAIPTQKLIDDVSAEIDIAEYSHALRDNDIRHIKNSHGEGTNEKYPVTSEDIKLIPWIVQNYDKVFVVKRDNGRTGIIYVKVNEQGLLYFLEQATTTYGSEPLLVNKQMIKTGINDIPNLKGFVDAINKKQSEAEFLADLKKVHEVYARSAYQPHFNNIISKKVDVVNNDYSTNTDNIKYDMISEREQKYIQTICDKLGRGVAFEDMREMHYKGKIISPDGYIKNGVIHLNIYSENPIGFVFKHELTHFAEKASGYAEFVRGVKDSGVYKKWLCEKMGESDIKIAEYKYKRQVAQSHSDIYSASDPKAEAEMIADFVGEMLFTDNGSGMASLVSDVEVKHRNKVVQFVVDFISYLRKKLSGIKALTLELSKLEDRFNELLFDAKNSSVNDNEIKFSFAGSRGAEKLYDTSEALKPENDREWSEFNRQFANKTSDLKNNKQKNIIICTENNVYFVSASGYMAGCIEDKVHIDGNEENINEMIKEYSDGTFAIGKIFSSSVEEKGREYRRGDRDIIGTEGRDGQSENVDLDERQPASDDVAYNWENYGYKTWEELIDAIDSGALIMDDNGNIFAVEKEKHIKATLDDEVAFSMPVNKRNNVNDTVSEREQNYIQTICDKLGRGVVFEDLREMHYKGKIISPDGYIENGVIHLNIYAENPIGFVFKHELTHFAEKASGYAEFVRGVKDSKVYKKWLCEKMGESDIKIAEYKYKRQAAQSHIDIYSASDPKAEAEMIADFVGEMLFTDNGSGMASLVSNVEVKHRNKVVQFVVDFISWLKKKIGGIKSLTLELSVLEDSFNRIVSEATELENKGLYKYDDSISFCFVACTNQERINAAEELESQGYDRLYIFENCGLIRDAYGRWKYELNTREFRFYPDGNAKTDSHYFNYKLQKPDGSFKGKLSDFVLFKSLFELYPQLKDITVVIKKADDTVKFIINDEKENGKEPVLFINKRLSDDFKSNRNNDIKSHILRELQRAIQYINGEYIGKSLDYWEKMEKEGKTPYSEKLGRKLTAQEAHKYTADNYEAKIVETRRALRDTLTKTDANKGRRVSNIDDVFLYSTSVERDMDILFDDNENPFISKEYLIPSKDNSISDNNEGTTAENEVVPSLPDGVEENGGNSFEAALEKNKNSNKLRRFLSAAKMIDKNNIAQNLNISAGSDSLISNVADNAKQAAEYFNQDKINELSRKILQRIDSVGRALSDSLLEKFKDTIFKNEKGQMISLYTLKMWGIGGFEHSKLGLVAGTLEAAEQLYAEYNDGSPRNRDVYIQEIFVDMKNPLVLHYTPYEDSIRGIHDLVEREILFHSEFMNLINQKSAAKEPTYSGLTTRKTREAIQNAGYDGIIYFNDSTDKGSMTVIIFDESQMVTVAENGILQQNNGITEDYFDLATAEDAAKKVNNDKNIKLYTADSKYNKRKYRPVPDERIKAGNSGFMEKVTSSVGNAKMALEKNLAGNNEIALSGKDVVGRNLGKNITGEFDKTFFKDKNGNLLSFFAYGKKTIDLEKAIKSRTLFGTLNSAINDLVLSKEKSRRSIFGVVQEFYINSVAPLVVELDNLDAEVIAKQIFEEGIITEKEYYRIISPERKNPALVLVNKLDEKGFDSIVFVKKTGECAVLPFDAAQVFTVADNGIVKENSGVTQENEIEEYNDNYRIDRVVIEREGETPVDTQEIRNIMATECDNTTKMKLVTKVLMCNNNPAIDYSDNRTAGHSGILEKNKVDILNARAIVTALINRDFSDISIADIDTAGRIISEYKRQLLRESKLVDKYGRPLSVFVFNRYGDYRFNHSQFGLRVSTLNAVHDTSIFERENSSGYISGSFEEYYPIVKNPYFLTFDPENLTPAMLAKYLLEEGTITNKQNESVLVRLGADRAAYHSGASNYLTRILKEKGFDCLAFMNERADPGSIGLIVFDKSQLIPVAIDGLPVENSDRTLADSDNEPAFLMSENESENFVEKDKNDLLDGVGNKEYNENVEQLAIENLTKDILKNKPKYSPNPKKWLKRGGKITVDEHNIWTYINSDGVSVKYINGYPDFKSAGLVVQEVNIGEFKNRKYDTNKANALAPNGPRENGNVWHHSEDGKILQEISGKIHKQFTHQGGICKMKGIKKYGI